MKKTIVLLVISLILSLVPLSVSAEPVGDAVEYFALQAQRYYNTNVAFSDMIVSRDDANTFTVTHYTSQGKTLKTVLYKTEWGTWNLGDLKYSDGIQEKVVIGGATDWEYVFRVVNPINQNLEFTGGNHGSETMVSLAMCDAVTGENFELGVGESRYVNRLVVKENTKINLGNVDYLDYANVKRVYTFVGCTVNLDCEIEFTRDVRMALSYTTMASVNKEFSRYCFFDNGTFVTTEPFGSVSNKYLGNVRALSCQMSGDDDSVSVNVGIYNPKDMTDNFANRDKVFFWDMTDKFNKLYFSKYDMTTITKVEKGTKWDFGSYWTVNFK